MEEWISVEEMLPVKEGFYLCYVKRGFHIILKYKKYKHKTRKFYSQMNNIPTEDVTDWKPLTVPKQKQI